MARRLTNVSGETRTLQDSAGRWHVVEPDAIYTVDDADDRYYQTGECGEQPIWAEVAAPKISKKPTTKDEE